MFSRAFSMRSAGKASFSGLVAYLTRDQDKMERVGTVTVSNCIAPTLADAVLEVANTQLLNKRSRADKTYHFVFTFPAGERVTPEVLAQIEREMVGAMGFGEHQRVSVVHHDTDHLHVHVAINKIHPTKLTAVSPGWCRFVRDRECARLEKRFGLRVDKHHCDVKGMAKAGVREQLAACGLDQEIAAAQSWAAVHACTREQDVLLRRGGQGLVFEASRVAVIAASSVSRELSLAKLESRLGPFEDGDGVAQTGPEAASAKLPDVPGMEPVAGKESFVGWVQREHSKAMLATTSWAELHAVAKGAGLVIKPKGPGLIVGDAKGHFCSASAVARGLSKGLLQRRLGAFEPATTAESVVTVGSQASAVPKSSAPKGAVYEERDMVGPTAGQLYARYQSAQVERGWQLGAAKEEVWAQKEREVERVKGAAAKRREIAKTFFRTKKERIIWRAAAKQASTRDWQLLRERHQARLKSIQSLYGRQGWMPWLQASGAGKDLEALVELRRRGARFDAARKANVVGGAPARVDAFLPGLVVDSVTKLGTVVYRLGESTLKDDGRSLSLSGKLDEEAAAALLYGCRELHGSVVGVAGEKAFREALVAVAVKFDVDITFADAEMETQRKTGVKARYDRQEGAGPIHRRATPGQWFARIFGGGATQRNPFKSHFGFASRQRSGGLVAQSAHAVSGLPTVDVVSHAEGARAKRWDPQGRKTVSRRARRAGVLLPGEASGDVQQRRSAREIGLRRAHAAGVDGGVDNGVARMLARDAVRARGAGAKPSSGATTRRGR